MTTPVVSPAVGNAWLTLDQENAVAGQVANPVYPGPITGDHEGGSETIPGRDPVGGQETSELPPDEPDAVSDGGGGYAEHDYSGHAAPVAPFDSNAKPFASSGALADTHGFDTGGVERHTLVAEPQAKGWFRKVLTGMTYDRQAQVTDNKGWQINTPTGRQDLDQYQGKNGDAYDPFHIPYSERPIYANLAAEAVPLNGTPDAYTPSGQLMDMTPTGGQGNTVYVEPSDPAVTTAPTSGVPAPSSPDFDGGWF